MMWCVIAFTSLEAEHQTTYTRFQSWVTKRYLAGLMCIGRDSQITLGFWFHSYLKFITFMPLPTTRFTMLGRTIIRF